MPKPHLHSPLNLYQEFRTEFISFLESRGVSVHSALRLAWLAEALLQGRKKSISSLQRVYFPQFTIKSIVLALHELPSKFRSLNRILIKRVIKTWSANQRIFIICDDYMILRYSKKGYRIGKFRDPVSKRVRLGHNLVDTIITDSTLETTADFTFQPSNSRVPKTKRALRQIQKALSLLQSANRQSHLITLLIDGGYTNRTVLLPVQQLGLKYIGTIRRNKKFKLFGCEHQLQQTFSHKPPQYRHVAGKKYYWEKRTLNLTDLGRHQVFHLQRENETQGKFYITNDLKMTLCTFLKRLNDRWWIEQNHRDLKQHCGLKHLFVWKRQSVKGLVALSYLLKNFLGCYLAETGINLREYPLERLVENEYDQITQLLVQSALKKRVLTN